MIPIIEESEEMYLNTHVYEKCVFCGVDTKYWHEETNTPICYDCSLTHDVEDIKPRKSKVKFT